MGIHVRTRIASIQDAPALASMNAAFNDSLETSEQIAQRLADPHRVETPIIAELDDEIVGFAAVRLVPCVFYPAPHAELTELFVEPGYRRRGIGRALLLHAERLALDGGADELVLLTGFTNQAAQALYRSLGYEDLDLQMYKHLRPT
jgi:ribosomal protein S18 acetylase RimI-like enzyme